MMLLANAKVRMDGPCGWLSPFSARRPDYLPMHPQADAILTKMAPQKAKKGLLITCDQVCGCSLLEKALLRLRG